jgi:hypothetical protein
LFLIFNYLILGCHSVLQRTLLIPPSENHYDCITEFEHKAAVVECARTGRAMEFIARAIMSAKAW